MSYKVEFVCESSSSALGPSGHPFGDGLRSMTHKQTWPVGQQSVIRGLLFPRKIEY